MLFHENCMVFFDPLDIQMNIILKATWVYFLNPCGLCYRLLKPDLINSILIKNIQSVGCTGFCQGGIFHTGLKAVFSNLNFKEFRTLQILVPHLKR